jgi:outer membrane protein insertion porin family
LLALGIWLGALSIIEIPTIQAAAKRPSEKQVESKDDQEDAFIDTTDISDDDDDENEQGLKIISNIIVEGNRYVPTDAILARVPYRVGHLFDEQKTNALLRSVYDLGLFKHVRVLVEDVDGDHINLIVIVQEKKIVEGIYFQGNKHLKEHEIKKKFDYTELRALDEEDVQKYVNILKKLYREKDYHNVEIKPVFTTHDDKVSVTFQIKEGHKSLVKRVFFKGNKSITSKKLRSIIFTREDWILDFLDRAGSYQPEAIEADKRVIENYYQSNGFLNARVVDTEIALSSNKEDIFITFHIYEGNQYTISDIKVSGGNNVVCDEIICQGLPIKVGDLFSKDKIRAAIEYLRLIWGEYGYIYADIEPSIQPNEETKTVELGFYTELGPQVYLNRINIYGNIKTHDKVIRRQLLLQEGCLLTTKLMDDSKAKVEGLGYFDPRNGVNWKINRIGKDRADLDLILKEVKTGRFEYQMGIGGSVSDFSSPMESLNVKLALYDTNFLGRGIHLNLSGEYAKEERTILFSIIDPWLFDRPIQGGVDFFIKRASYDDFEFIDGKDIQEKITGGNLNLGFLWRQFFDSQLSFRIGIEGITYRDVPKLKDSSKLTKEDKAELQNIFNQRFSSGDFIWISANLFKDIRNHPMHPSRGYQWLAQSKLVVPSEAKNDVKKGFGFFKIDLDGSWYTPLIGERDLVFGLHGHLGLIVTIDDYKVPFRELYNIGGPASVRGFLFGEIGPNWVGGRGDNSRNPLGGKKAFWLNAELIFPITNDFALKGAVFYDGGAGWDTPHASEIGTDHLRNNNFKYRQSVGFGVRMLRPTPMRIDWGFKLDRERGERVSEVHFSGYHEF